MIIDKLYQNIKEKSCICLGLDVDLSYIPESMKGGGVCQEIFRFNKAIIDASKDLVAIYKPQIAHYEALGLEGLKAYKETLEYIKAQGCLSIGDIKRSDIASTAEKYAKAHFAGDFEADFITLNPYMGLDSLEAYLPYLESGEKGVFVLLRTSNKGSKDIQMLDYKGEPLFYHIGDQLEDLGKDLRGKSNYSALGFVTGGTHGDEGKKIRDRYKNTLFLIPGYGAQGAGGSLVRDYLGEDLSGGVVNSSRGIIKNHLDKEDGDENFAYYIREAIIKMKDDIYGL